MRYQQPTADQVAAMQATLPPFMAIYDAVLANVPNGADRTLALRHLQEARMWANRAILLLPT